MDPLLEPMVLPPEMQRLAQSVAAMTGRPRSLEQVCRAHQSDEFCIQGWDESPQSKALCGRVIRGQLEALTSLEARRFTRLLEPLVPSAWPAEVRRRCARQYPGGER